jgi:dihydrodipicolinate synthase/N-acetylneuraminate lyase
MNCYDRNALRGAVVVPLATPFHEDGRPDEDGLLRLVDFITDGGCQGVLILGTSGEAASISPEDRMRITEISCERLKEKGGAFIGIGDNCLSTSIAYARHALKAGADAVVAHCPSYFPIGPAELEAYYLKLADSIDGALFIYNIPSTTHHSIPLDTIEVLSHHRNIVGVKDSEANLERLVAVSERFRDRDDFVVLCGAAGFSAPAMKAGALGFVPSAGNIAPAICRKISDRSLAGDFPAADVMQSRMDNVNRIYAKGGTLADTLPRLKVAMSLLGFGSGAVLPPLLTMKEELWGPVREEMIVQGLL